jgi:hypothetical protein
MPSTGNQAQSEIRVGQRIGQGVIEEMGLRIGRRSLLAARLRCDCGQSYTRPLIYLRRGDVQSCGCLRRERGRANPVMTASTHGMSGHPLYHIWYLMIGRCENPAHPRYRDYGGRGITVCERWHDVAVFISDIERLIGPRPDGRTASGKRPHWTIDRADPDGNYEPGNLRWATYSQQRRNRRTSPARRR